MATGKAACRKARPTRAGLKTFCPRPPQTIFPNPMPKAPPSAAIQSGIPAGSVRPSSRPVMTADPSAREPPRPKARSVTRAPIAAAPMTSRALIPKNQVAAPITGTNVPTTFHMMTGVESCDRTCGDAVMTRPGWRDALMSPPPCGRATQRHLAGLEELGQRDVRRADVGARPAEHAVRQMGVGHVVVAVHSSQVSEQRRIEKDGAGVEAAAAVDAGIHLLQACLVALRGPRRPSCP